MGTFEQIRRISPYFFGLFAVMLVLFFTIGDQTVTDAITGQRNDPKSQILGSVNKQSILYVEFEEKVRERAEQQRSQLQDPTQQIDEAQIRSQVWNEMVDKILLQQEAEKAGITITDNMIRDELIENPPDYLTQSFMDSAGNFQKDLYLRLVTNPEDIIDFMGVDPSQITEQQRAQQVNQFRNDLLLIEKFLKEQLLNQAMQTAVKSSAGIISPEYAKMQFLNENSNASFSYIAMKISDMNNPEVEVSDAEIKKFYDKRKHLYTQDPQRKLKYVSLKITPSSEDTSNAIRRIERIMESLNSVNTVQEKDSVFDIRISEYSGENHDYTYIQDMSPEVMQYVGMAETGHVMGPYRTSAGTSFFRVDDRRSGENVSVKASHILISFNDNKDSAKAEAEKILREARSGEDFAKLAMQYSQDPGSKMNGGDVGYFGKGRMVPEFEEAAFAANKGDIVGPVESQFGYHIISVEDKNSEEIKYSEISISPRISSISKNMIYRQAASIAQQVEEGTPIDTVIKRINKTDKKNLRVNETKLFEKGEAILNSKYISDKSFELELGDVISPDEYDNHGIVVAQVSEVKEEGIKQLEDLRADILGKIEKQKRLDMLKKVADDTYSRVKSLDSLSKASGMVEYEVNSLQNINKKPYISGIGKEPVLAHNVFNSTIGAVSEPIRGENGYYIIQVHSRNIPDMQQVEANYPTKLNELKRNAAQASFMQWFTKVKENAKIEDNRNQYYREY